MVETPPIDPLPSTEPLVNENGTPTEFFQRKWAGQQELNVSYDDLVSLVAVLQAQVAALQALVLTAGTGLNGGGDLTADRVFDLANTAVTAAAYTSADITIDAQGRITAAANGAGGSAGTIANVLHVQDQKATTVQSGSSVVGVQTRTLNTVVVNDITGASLAANQFTLPAGSYDIWCSAPGHDCGQARAYVYNITDAAVEVLGNSTFNWNSDNQQENATVIGRITIAATKVFELRHYISLAKATFGLGHMVGDGNTEIYADVFVRRVIGTTAGAVELNDIDDVNTPAPSDKDFLQWSTGTLKWINFDLFGAVNAWAAAQTFSDKIISDDTTEATSTTAAAIQTDGGIAAAKKIIAGQGIYLGGTAAANLLDDAETGTFTPVVAGDVTAGVFTYARQNGDYFKIGDTVIVVIDVQVTATSTSPVGGVRVSLPFTASSQLAEIIGAWDGIVFPANGTSMTLQVSGASTGILLQIFNNGNNLAAVNAATFNAAFRLRFTGSYSV